MSKSKDKQSMKDYLKLTRLAPPPVEMPKDSRPYKRLLARALLKKFRWRQFRDHQGADHKISFRKRLAIIERATA